MLALLPLALAAVLLAVDAAVAGDLLVVLSSSWAAYLALSFAVLAAILAAAYARRDNVILSSAWLFLFCGMMLLSLAELLEMSAAAQSWWVSDLFETAGLVPVLIFVGYVSAPLRILVLDRRRAILYAVIAAAVILLVALLTFVPWLRPGGRPHPGRLLRVLKPELDALLLSPLALLLLTLGAVRRAQPYLFVGIGLLLMLPSDLFSHYHAVSRVALHEQLATMLLFMSQLYVLTGALACVLTGCRETGGKTEP